MRFGQGLGEAAGRGVGGLGLGLGVDPERPSLTERSDSLRRSYSFDPRMISSMRSRFVVGEYIAIIPATTRNVFLII